MKKVLYWSPRILAILFIAFISMFALDVFTEPSWPLALLMHLLPSVVLIILTILSWKKNFAGAIIFFVFGLFTTWFTHFESPVVVIPIFIISILFFIDSKSDK